MQVLFHYCLLLLSFSSTGSSLADEDQSSKLEQQDVPENVRESEIEKEDGVYVLTDENFDSFLEQNPTSLIEFYAPWCGHCKQLVPEYSAAALKLQGSVPLAKVDTTVHKELGKRFDIQGFPTIKFWQKDHALPINYDGERDSAGAVTAKKLAPEYEKAARKLKEHNILLGKVDATVEKKLSDQYGVQGFPTMKIFRHGRRFDYDGPRDAMGIVNYMIEQSMDAAKELMSVKEAQKFMAFDDVTIIGFFNHPEKALFEAFIEAAEKTRSDFTVGYTTNKDVMKHFKASPNHIVLFYPEIYWSKYEPRTRVYSKQRRLAQLLEGVFHTFGWPEDKKNAPTRYSKLPLVVVYYNVDFTIQHRQGTQYWRKKVLDIANKFKDQKYHFAVADEQEFEQELNDLGLGDSGLEHNVVVFGVDGKKYPMNPDEFDDGLEENLQAFLAMINKGMIKPYVKSAPVPKDDKGPVKTVVGANFAKIVGDENKDVLVEFYAPWCGHCQKFESKYKQFATKWKSEKPNLLIAKFDATANDPPEKYAVEGFPTIYFAPAGKKDKPIKYSGNRDLNDLEKFVRKHAVKSFQTPKKTEDKDEL